MEKWKKIQQQIDAGTYVCPAILIADKLLKKNPKLEENAKVLKNNADRKLKK